MYIRIGNEEMVPGAFHCVFAAFYAEDGKPYRNYKDVSENHRNTVIPTVMMQLRWDGTFGFPGGKVDGEETLREALVREVQEEVNYNIQHLIDKVHLVGSYSTKERKMCQHCFGIHVPYEELKRIRMCSLTGEHIDSENSGSVLVHIMNYGPNSGFEAFRQNNFKATAGMELDDLVNQMNWIQ